MSEWGLVVSAVGTMALLMLVQILVSDILGIRARHVPGAPVTADHGNVLFRASRVVANTNESIAVFILAVVFCVLAEVSSAWVGYVAWGFVIARAAYALCYYADQRVARSIVFGLSLICLAALLGLGAFA